MEVLLDELQECMIVQNSTEQRIERQIITDSLNRFLASLDQESRMIFIERYWYMKPVKEIAQVWQCSESKVKSSLFRTRKKLKVWLEREGIAI